MYSVAENKVQLPIQEFSHQHIVYDTFLMSSVPSEKRVCTAAAKVTDENNTAAPETSAHCEARDHAARLAASKHPSQTASSSSTAIPTNNVLVSSAPTQIGVSTPSTKRKSPTIEDFDDDDDPLIAPRDKFTLLIYF